MTKQLLFAAALLVTFGVFFYTLRRLARIFKLTHKTEPVRQFGKRLMMTLRVAFGQNKIIRKPVVGSMHALVFWGFCVILIGSIEMVIDGLAGTDRIFRFLGVVYDVITASADVFALVILVLIIFFLIRRLFMRIKRFNGIEMSHRSHRDALFALTLILLLMVSLLGMNASYYAGVIQQYVETAGYFPVGRLLAGLFSNLTISQLHSWHELFWWSHILLIFFFANYLPYSKHFHVYLSIPNVFLSRLEPLGKLSNMESVTREVKLMLEPSAEVVDTGEDVARFGVLDAQDVTWKNYLDSLTCTQCGRCTEVCPANITGKKLSPRKIMMDLRARMKEKAPGLLREGAAFDDHKSLIRDYISPEEIWACTTCNACARECPLNINHPSLIIDMRRYLVMEESAAPGEINAIFSNIENNGAPWQFAQDDRMNWTTEPVPVMADLAAQGKTPEYLFWVGSAGAFDDRYKQVARAFVKILNFLKIDYAVLGTEESSSGDVARRTGNEMLFQMQALSNIEIMNGYGVQKILTCDPHVFNTFKNEYPELGGHYTVIHHTQFLEQMLQEGSLTIDNQVYNKQVLTYHDPCYLGRANQVYEPARTVIRSLSGSFVEMKRNRSFALCCGAGGGQMFKEAESGEKEIFMERTDDALETGAEVVVTACPYCLVMLTDGMKYNNREADIKVKDLAELVAESLPNENI
ncbi:MAG: 4Fe-4S dicluster domain-containing protein [Bacteroidales bacterium]|nr:4Fe-4S dicluster domain-containing protein [Bacteroidales bacterium]